MRLDGWAIEARVYAEDPRRGFLPSIGRLVRYQEPVGTGRAGRQRRRRGRRGLDVLRPDDRQALRARARPATATARLSRALDGFLIRGVSHNIPFLAAVLATPRFADGRLTTNFIAEEFGDRFQGRELDEVPAARHRGRGGRDAGAGDGAGR